MKIVTAMLALCVSLPASAGDREQLSEMGYDAHVVRPSEKCPGAENGQELIGKPAKEWMLTHWMNSEPLTLAKLKGRVVVVRFWTSGCEFCEQSMPALEKLAKEFKGKPLTIVGAFHAKPVTSATDMSAAKKVADGWGISFPLALDDDWKTLRSWYLDGHHRHASSATVVIGKDGRIVHVHPGPSYFPSSEPNSAHENEDYLALRAAIAGALQGQSFIPARGEGPREIFQMER